MVSQFDQIYLSDEELDLLRSYASSNSCSISGSKPVMVLAANGLLEENRKNYGRGCLEHDGSYRISPIAYSYLRYLDDKARRRKAEARRARAAIAVSILALLVSVISIVWQAYTWKIEREQLLQSISPTPTTSVDSNIPTVP